MLDKEVSFSACRCVGTHMCFRHIVLPLQQTSDDSFKGKIILKKNFAF